MPLSARRGHHDKELRRDTNDARNRANYCPHPLRAFRARSAHRAVMAHQAWVGAGSNRSAVLPVSTGRQLGCRQTAATAAADGPELHPVAARPVCGSYSIHSRFYDLIVAGLTYLTSFSVYLFSGQLLFAQTRWFTSIFLFLPALRCRPRAFGTVAPRHRTRGSLAYGRMSCRCFGRRRSCALSAWRSLSQPRQPHRTPRSLGGNEPRYCSRRSRARFGTFPSSASGGRLHDRPRIDNSSTSFVASTS